MPREIDLDECFAVKMCTGILRSVDKEHYCAAGAILNAMGILDIYLEDYQKLIGNRREEAHLAARIIKALTRSDGNHMGVVSQNDTGDTYGARQRGVEIVLAEGLA